MNTESILIKNGRLINPSNDTDDILDILIKDGKIAATGKDINEDAGIIIDAKNKVVAPGLVDIHVHFREPGLEYKEDIQTGSEAAAAGGVTTVLCMPNTKPVVDNPQLVKYVLERGRRIGKTNVLTSASITKGQLGEELSEIGQLKDAGAKAITDDGRPVVSSSLMKRALKYAKMFDIPVLSHSEDLDLVDGGQINEGAMSTYLGLKGIPKTAESVAVSRDVLLAEEENARLHICHISTKNSVDAIRQAKKRGANITAETAPHYFSLTDKALDNFNTNAKMNPPLRDEEDINAVIEGLKDGTLDAIATDHAPHSNEEKESEFSKAPNGIVGLETSLALSLTKLYKTKKLSLLELFKKLSYNPSRIIGIKKGTLDIGADADIVVFDAENEFTVNTKEFRSKSNNCPYNNMKLYGKVCYTILGGKIVFEGGK